LWRIQHAEVYGNPGGGVSNRSEAVWAEFATLSYTGLLKIKVNA